MPAPPVTYTSYKPLQDVLAERIAQDEQWGGSAHDDTHNPEDWFHFISVQNNKWQNDWLISDNPQLKARLARTRLIKIAALALAGIASIDRKTLTLNSKER